MALSNLDRVNKGLELLHAGLHAFVISQLTHRFGEAHWQQEAIESFPPGHHSRSLSPEQWDIQALLHLMNKHWKGCFDQLLGYSERAMVSELMEVRKRSSHQNKTNPFDTNDAYRAMDNVVRLLTAIGAPQVAEAEVQAAELLRIRFEENTRKKAKTMTQAQLIDTVAGSNLTPWRQVIEPHPDVASGRYQKAEFAADLWAVYKEGTAMGEYGKPVDFFNRTYLTGGLRKLLTNALKRLNGKGGDPVINLQTNFGGGKTHSLLALYHLVSGADLSSVRDLEAFFGEMSGLRPPDGVAVAVLAGNKISPAVRRTMDDGTVVNTLWGEMAWQLGKKEGYEMLRDADQKGVSPGETLVALFRRFGPCLILIDEWVMYVRQLADTDGSVSGTYGTHMTFVQTLCEAVKLVDNALLVVSLPSADAEMGGERGKIAAAELKRIVGRIESPWSVATTEESFEIVTRRLFSPIITAEAKQKRDAVARAFGDFYRANKKDFPTETSASEYEARIRDYYPIHPELFDALADRWASIEKFQKTRGILRLMANIIHFLWEQNDASPLILPAHVPLDKGSIQSEMMNYLEDPWSSVIHKDVDGANALPRQIDAETPRFGQIQAARRVARTLFFSSAPTHDAANRGVDEQRLKLGSILPGENIPVFADALRHLISKGTYIYSQNNHYWYSTQNNVNRTAEERAVHIKDEDITEVIHKEMAKWLEAAGRNSARTHLMPQSSADVPDDLDLKLVILGAADCHSTRDLESDAYKKAKDILLNKGSGQRMYRNTLVFVAPDKTRLAELQDAARRHLAWSSIKDDAIFKDLTGHQRGQVETSIKGTLDTVKARLPEVFIWALTPYQEKGTTDVQWEEARLSGQDGLVAKVTKKLISSDFLKEKLGPTVLREEMAKHNLWRGGSHISLRQLRDDFTKYLYLPKLLSQAVLRTSIEEGVNTVHWRLDTFAYADGWDEEKSRYKGLRTGQLTQISLDSDAVLVQSDAAHEQLEREKEEPKPQPTPTPSGGSTSGGATFPTTSTSSTGTASEPTSQPAAKKSFHGHIDLKAIRFFRDAENIEKEILKHLIAAKGANVEITLHIRAKTDAGFDADTIRTVKENGRTLNFGAVEFEEE